MITLIRIFNILQYIVYHIVNIFMNPLADCKDIEYAYNINLIYIFLVSIPAYIISNFINSRKKLVTQIENMKYFYKSSV